MNILLYTDSDVFAGTESHILDLALSLRTLHQNPTIACPHPGALADRALAEKIPFLPIPKQGTLDRHAIRLLSQKLAHNHFDILHAHNGRTHLAAALAVKSARKGTCLATQHFLSPTRTTRTGPKALLARLLHNHAAAYTAHTIAISHCVRAAALARRDTAEHKITTIHNGINPPTLPQNFNPTSLRASLHIPQDAPLILCAARLQKEKDLPTLLRAMNRVSSQHPTAHCLIAGEGDQLHSLQSLRHSLLLTANVHFLGFRNDIPSLLAACDLFVLPSLAEPFGLVLLEAMALAKPLIATNTGGPPEIIAHEKTGLLVPPSDPLALASAISSLLANPQKRQAFASASHARYLSHFTAHTMASHTLALYQKSLASKKIPLGCHGYRYPDTHASCVFASYSPLPHLKCYNPPMTTLRVHFDGHVFVPDEPVYLTPGSGFEAHLHELPHVSESSGEVTIGTDPITDRPFFKLPPGSPPITMEDVRRAQEDDFQPPANPNRAIITTDPLTGFPVVKVPPGTPLISLEDIQRAEDDDF